MVNIIIYPRKVFGYKFILYSMTLCIVEVIKNHMFITLYQTIIDRVGSLRLSTTKIKKYILTVLLL